MSITIPAKTIIIQNRWRSPVLWTAIVMQLGALLQLSGLLEMWGLDLGIIGDFTAGTMQLLVLLGVMQNPSFKNAP